MNYQHVQIVSGYYTVIGIVSFGASCGVMGVPQVYTNVPVLLSWILDTMQNLSSTSGEYKST